MTTAVQDPGLAFIGGLTLPDGRLLRDSTFKTDPWFVDDVLAPILAVGDDGLPEHKLVYIELARGHFKTGGVAAIAIAEAIREPGTDIFCCASDKEQAALILESIAGQCKRNRSLSAAFRQTKSEFEVRQTGSKIRVLSSDVPSAFGLGVNCKRLRIICDELTMWGDAALFYAMQTTAPKIANSQLIVISNAGVGPGEAWQWQIRESSGEHGYLYSAEGTIASWITAESLAQVEAVVPAPVYQRFHENRWVEAEGEFLSMALWDACQSEIPPLPRKVEGVTVARKDMLVVGCDAAVSGDSFAIVSVSRDPSRPHDSVLVRECRIWRPPPGGSIDFSLPWDYLADLVKRHHVTVVVYDVYQLYDFMARFAREHRTWCLEFGQGPDRSRADSSLFQLVRQQRLKHDGDPGLREHIGNCGFQVAPKEDTRGRICKSGKGKIDAAVALSMGASTCLELVLE